MEPHISKVEQLPYKFVSLTFVIFSIMVVMAAVISIIVYRLFTEVILYDQLYRKKSSILEPLKVSLLTRFDLAIIDTLIFDLAHGH